MALILNDEYPQATPKNAKDIAFAAEGFEATNAKDAIVEASQKGGGGSADIPKLTYAYYMEHLEEYRGKLVDITDFSEKAKANAIFCTDADGNNSNVQNVIDRLGEDVSEINENLTSIKSVKFNGQTNAQGNLSVYSYTDKPIISVDLDASMASCLAVAGHNSAGQNMLSFLNINNNSKLGQNINVSGTIYYLDI